MLEVEAFLKKSPEGDALSLEESFGFWAECTRADL